MSNRMLTQREWDVRRSFASDSISIRNLHLIANVGFDIWGRKKAQPVDVSIRLSLSEPITSAANADSLDGSTINYGKLSKALIASVELMNQWTHPYDFVWQLSNAAQSTIMNAKAISVTEIDISFPKASRFGDAAGLIVMIDQEGNICSNFYLKDLRLHSLIGVNSHEREMKQALVVSLWIDRATPHIINRHFEAEQIIAKTVEESSFETLESLAEKLASNVTKYFILADETISTQPEPASVRLRLEKPSAVALADAPVIEICRGILLSDAYGQRIREELDGRRHHIPFPLHDRLDQLVASLNR